MHPSGPRPELRDLPLREYAPRARLRVPEHHVPRARFPAIDAHNHLGRWLADDGRWSAPDVGRLLALMDACNVEAIVNLDGRWGGELEANLDRYDRAPLGGSPRSVTSTGRGPRPRGSRVGWWAAWSARPRPARRV